MVALGILVPTVQVRALAFQQIQLDAMNTTKTIKGVSFYARTQSLGDAQRSRTPKSDREHRLSDEFIRPMWKSPERKKETK